MAKVSHQICSDNSCSCTSSLSSIAYSELITRHEHFPRGATPQCTCSHPEVGTVAGIHRAPPLSQFPYLQRPGLPPERCCIPHSPRGAASLFPLRPSANPVGRCDDVTPFKVSPIHPIYRMMAAEKHSSEIFEAEYSRPVYIRKMPMQKGEWTVPNQQPFYSVVSMKGQKKMDQAPILPEVSSMGLRVTTIGNTRRGRREQRMNPPKRSSTPKGFASKNNNGDAIKANQRLANHLMETWERHYSSRETKNSNAESVSIISDNTLLEISTLNDTSEPVEKHWTETASLSCSLLSLQDGYEYMKEAPMGTSATTSCINITNGKPGCTAEEFIRELVDLTKFLHQNAGPQLVDEDGMVDVPLDDERCSLPYCEDECYTLASCWDSPSVSTASQNPNRSSCHMSNGSIANTTHQDPIFDYKDDTNANAHGPIYRYISNLMHQWIKARGLCTRRRRDPQPPSNATED